MKIAEPAIKPLIKKSFRLSDSIEDMPLDKVPMRMKSVRFRTCCNIRVTALVGWDE
jgi:hypothetical protein